MKDGSIGEHEVLTFSFRTGIIPLVYPSYFLTM